MMYKELKHMFKSGLKNKKEDLDREEMEQFIIDFISVFNDPYDGTFKKINGETIIHVFNPYRNMMTGFSLFFPDSLDKRITKTRTAMCYFLTETGSVIIKDNYGKYYKLSKCNISSIKLIYKALTEANYTITKKLLKIAKKTGI